MSVFVVNKVWVTVQEGAELMGISRHILYAQIRQSRNFPQSSPFKKGIHWRPITERRYQVNVEEWQKALLLIQ